MKELLLDVSHYNNPLDYSYLSTKGIKCIIAKAGQGCVTDDMVEIHASGAHRTGMVLGLYYWADPLQDALQQVAHFKVLIKKLKPNFVAVDNEQWWASWPKWYKMIQGKLDAGDVPRLSPQQIDKTARIMLSELVVAGYKTLHYTRYSFLQDYDPLAYNWVRNYDLWVAQWPMTGGDLKKHSVSWEELEAKFFPTTNPYIPPGYPAPKLWQWTGDRFCCPGHDGRIDANWFMGDDLTKWAGLPVPPTPDDQVVQRRLRPWVDGLNVREAANANAGTRILRVIVRGDTFYTEDDTKKKNTCWIKLVGEPGWVNANYIE